MWESLITLKFMYFRLRFHMHSNCFIVILLCYYRVFLCFQVFTLIGAPIEKRSEKELKTLKFSILYLWPTPWLAPQTLPWRVQAQLPSTSMFPTTSTKAPQIGLVAGAMALWRTPQEEKFSLPFSSWRASLSFPSFYSPINRDSKSLFQSSKLRTEANSELIYFT